MNQKHTTETAIETTTATKTPQYLCIVLLFNQQNQIVTILEHCELCI